jgi:tetratricopeptide (TPR) repeat protein
MRVDPTQSSVDAARGSSGRPIIEGMRESFVGRTGELSELRSAIDDAIAGRGSLTFVSGEPGIGKTRLVEAAVEGTPAEVDVRWANCWEGPTPPFWPWAQLIGTTFQDLSAAGGHEEGEATTHRFALFDAVSSHLRALDVPIVLVVDDLHWADTGSLLLMDFVSAELRFSPIAVIATYRDVEVAAVPEIKEAMERVLAKATHITLRGLVEDEVFDMLASAIGASPADELVVDVHRRTGGNPLFVAELGRLFAAQGVEAKRAAAVPAGIHGVISRRVSRLSDETRTLLACASAIGTEFRTDILADAAGVDISEALQRLDEAERGGIVAPSERFVARYAFSHALVRDVLYESLASSARRDLHRSIGEVIERSVGQDEAGFAAELAHHFGRAAPGGDVGKAIAYTIAAGQHALEQLAYEEGVEHFQSALGLLSLTKDDARRPEVLLELGDACLRAGDLPAARDAFMEAAALGRAREDADGFARAALGFGAGLSGFEVQLADQAQVDLLEEALTVVSPDDSSLRAWLLARKSVALGMQQSVELRRRAAEEAVGMARRVADPRALAYALSALCDATAGPDDCSARRDRAQEIVEIARSVGDRALELLGHRFAVVAHLELGDMRGADLEIQAFERVAELLKQPLYSWYVPLWRGMLAATSGRFDDAEAFAAQAEAIGARAHSKNSSVLACVSRWMVLLHQQRWDDAHEEGRRMVSHLGDLGNVYSDFFEAMWLAQTGRTDEASLMITKLREELSTLDVDSEWLPTMCQWAESVSLVRDVDAAIAAYELLLPYRHLVAVEGIGAGLRGSLEYHLGLLALTAGRRAVAAEHLEAAVEMNARLGSPHLVARAQEALARGQTDGPGEDADPSVFRHDGDFWTMSYADSTVRIKDAKGIRDIAALLARPGSDVAALDLASGGAAPSEGHSGELLDETARQLYKERLRDLEEEIEEAESMGDLIRAERGRSERDAITHELSAAYGLGGRPRRSGDAAERARTTVTRRIREAISRIEDVHAELGRHLQNSVRTGLFCAYTPERPIEWQL